MRQQIKQKWRPPLFLVLGGVLTVVLTAPIAGLLALRLLIEDFSFWHSTILVAVVVCLIAVFFGFLLWRLLLRPISALAHRAEALTTTGSANLTPLDHYGTQELRDLGQSVLTMAETLHNREATIRTYTDHVTHELKTQITAIGGAAELLQSAPNLSKEDQKLIDTIVKATRQMETRLAAMRQIAAAREPSYQGNCQLKELLPNLQAQAPELKLQMKNKTLNIPLSAAGLEIILRHMVENSAAHNATWVMLHAKQTDAGVALHIRDDGDGISKGNAGKIFEPFFTTKRSVGGTGMGLSIVQTILQTHKGKIEILDAEKGTSFRIIFSKALK